jgi:hypothetical protein
MRNTRRATTVLSEGDPAARAERTATNSTTHCSPTPRPPNNTSASPGRQARVAPYSRKDGQRTFAAILKSERWRNMIRLKNRSFAGNRIAKLVSGHSQTLCYQAKNAAVSALVKHGAASLLSLEPSSRGPILGLAFVGGGRLHVKPTCLDAHTLHTLQAQFAAALRSGAYFSAEVSDGRL